VVEFPQRRLKPESSILENAGFRHGLSARGKQKRRPKGRRFQISFKK